MSETIIIVGAGQAGLQTAISLRQGGFEGRVIVLGKEPHLPYQRPPLSKQVLKGEFSPEKCTLRQSEFLEQHSIDLRTSTLVEKIDSADRQVCLEDGRVIDFDHLVIATGARLNRLKLSGSSLGGVFYLRTIDDALALRERLAEGTRLVVAGGGYIGLEVAASARSLGCDVSVVEAEDHIMRRSALPPIADFLLERHRQEGVNFHLGSRMTEILGGRKVMAVNLDNGTPIDTDLLLMGIGVRPELRCLEDSGVETDRGILVDEHCRTNIEGVYAVGDCAQSRHQLYADPVVLESVQNAVSQGRICAANLLGQDAVYDDVPWFWSEQYDCRFQMAGLAQPGDDLVIRDSGPNSISVLSVGADRLNAIQCINAPKDYMAARKLIGATDSVDMTRLRQPGIELKELL